MFFRLLLRKIIPDKYHSQVQSIYFILRSLYYLGNKVTCPCCDRHFRKFLPDLGRPNAQCPRCASLERHRLLWLYLTDKTNFFKDKLKILDISPLVYFSQKCKSLPNLNYIDADIDSSTVAIKLDITVMPLLDNQFDGIICYHVLEHVQDDQSAMRELFRVLKPGGWAILQSPIDENRGRTFEDPSVIDPEDRKRVFGHSDHVRIYGLDYVNRIQNAGFIVIVDDYIKRLPNNFVLKYGLEEGEVIYYCTKPK